MIDLSPEGAHLYHQLRKKSPRTRNEEVEHAILEQAWNLSELRGELFTERDLDVQNIAHNLAKRHPTWSSIATRNLVTNTVRDFKLIGILVQTKGAENG